MLYAVKPDDNLFQISWTRGWWVVMSKQTNAGQLSKAFFGPKDVLLGISFSLKKLSKSSN